MNTSTARVSDTQSILEARLAESYKEYLAMPVGRYNMTLLEEIFKLEADIEELENSYV